MFYKVIFGFSPNFTSSGLKNSQLDSGVDFVGVFRTLLGSHEANSFLPNKIYAASGYTNKIYNNQQNQIFRLRLPDPGKITNKKIVFIQNFRLSKEAFRDLLNEVENQLKITKTERAVPNILKVACALKFCAQGSYQLSVGNDFNLGLAQPTVSVCLKEVFNAVERRSCPKWIKFEYSKEERRAKIYFYEKTGFPNIVGCTDGSHIKIISPKEEVKHLYYNRKEFCSLNALIVCDHVMNIRYVNAKYPGSYHDSHIRNVPALKAKIESDYRSGRNDFKFLGYSGYPLVPYMLTPFRNTEEASLEARFNKKHAQGRNIIRISYLTILLLSKIYE
ncbi:putative nuclease HARBI1 [Condylostylus longicornis]|uniref:putative nuclease HARBI1 n=1 Tax=Condylostylus longicornis TaxID=2530218 RepID=UPI00244E00EA|nr:putative nuclease HARBI1 [Condylostylus longicornis]